MKKNNQNKLICTNSKGYHDYTMIDSFEAGINLVGCEVKSIRNGEVSLKDSYVEIQKGQLILVNCYIKNYDKGSFSNVDSRRNRRLLMHKNEIMRLLGKVREKGYTIIPTKLYFAGSLVKIEINFARGKQLYDKKRDKMEKDIERDQSRAMSEAQSRG